MTLLPIGEWEIAPVSPSLMRLPSSICCSADFDHPTNNASELSFLDPNIVVLQRRCAGHSFIRN
jgi:hypothetical protein